jgi:hypothetical protein
VAGVDDLRKVAVGRGPGGTPVLLGEVANVQLGPEMRRGIAEFNGDGETVGGIVVVRYGVDTRTVIEAVRARLDAAMKRLPAGVSYTITYDRTALIDRAVKTLEEKLLEESFVIALVCALFLMRLRSAFVAIVILAVAVLSSFLIMFGQGLSANIMSLGGIAIAASAMVDAAIIMIEDAHQHLERDGGRKPHWEIIRDAFLLAAGYHGVVPPGIRVAGAGGTDVQAARLHENLFDGGRGAVVCYPRAGADGAFHSREGPAGGCQSGEPLHHLDLSSHPRLDDPVPLGGCHRGGSRGRLGVFSVERVGGAPASGRRGEGFRGEARRGVSLPKPRLGVHAAAQ